MVLTEKEITGVTCEIHVNEKGQFSVYEEGNFLGRGDKLEAAVAKARATLAKRKVEVSVPFRFIDGVAGVATGLHSSRGSVLVTVDGRKEEYRAQDTQAFKPDVPDDVLARAREINDSMLELTRERRELEKAHALALAPVVRSEIQRVANAEAGVEG